MKRASLLVVGLACTLLTGIARAGDLAGLSGHWHTVRHGAWVEIGDCGDGSPCGWLAWVDPDIAAGHHGQDVHNSDAWSRGRQLIGLPILGGFVPGPDGWRNGQLYNPEDGKTFRAHLDLLSPTELRVTGCLGPLPLCRSQVWTRNAAAQGMRGQP